MASEPEGTVGDTEKVTVSAAENVLNVGIAPLKQDADSSLVFCSVSGADLCTQ
jgi:hypothetical protein